MAATPHTRKKPGWRRVAGPQHRLMDAPRSGEPDLGSLGPKRGPVNARDVLGWATDHACTRARTSHTGSGDYAAVRHRGDMNDRSRTLTSGAGYSSGDGVWRRSDSTAIRGSRWGTDDRRLCSLRSRHKDTSGVPNGARDLTWARLMQKIAGIGRNGRDARLGRQLEGRARLYRYSCINRVVARSFLIGPGSLMGSFGCRANS